MNAKMVSDAMSEVDGKYIDEALFYDAEASHPRRFHRLPAALIAAVLALLLMGTAVAATVIYRDNIQSWFSRNWIEITGQAMSEEHRAVIESLSQEIGVSRTVGDVTVTADSATVGGDGQFYLLVKIDGIDLSDDTHSYCFRKSSMSVISKRNISTLYSICVTWDIEEPFIVNRGGEALMILSGEDFRDRFLGQDTRQDTPPAKVHISFQDLVRDAGTDEETIIGEGEWELAFDIDCSQPTETILLPDIEAKAMDTESPGYAVTPVTITNIELTNMGLYFQYRSPNGTLFLPEHKIAVILKNGSVIESDKGYFNIRVENDRACFHRWPIPIDLDEVAAVQFGETRIEIP